MNFEVGEILIASWYDEGQRSAGARVEANHIKVPEPPKGKKKLVEDAPEPEGHLQLRLFIPGGFPEPYGLHEDVVLQLENHRLIGPRRAAYQLTEPSPRDLEFVQKMIAANVKRLAGAAERNSRRELPAALREANQHRQRASGPSLKDRVLEFITSKSAPVDTEAVRTVAPGSAAAILSTLTREGAVVREKVDKRVLYSISGAKKAETKPEPKAKPAEKKKPAAKKAPVGKSSKKPKGRK